MGIRGGEYPVESLGTSSIEQLERGQICTTYNTTLSNMALALATIVNIAAPKLSRESLFVLRYELSPQSKPLP